VPNGVPFDINAYGHLVVWVRVFEHQDCCDILLGTILGPPSADSLECLLIMRFTNNLDLEVAWT